MTWQPQGVLVAERHCFLGGVRSAPLLPPPPHSTHEIAFSFAHLDLYK